MEFLPYPGSLPLRCRWCPRTQPRGWWSSRWLRDEVLVGVTSRWGSSQKRGQLTGLDEDLHDDRFRCVVVSEWDSICGWSCRCVWRFVLLEGDVWRERKGCGRGGFVGEADDGWHSLVAVVKAAGSGKNGLECSDEPFTHSSFSCHAALTIWCNSRVFIQKFYFPILWLLWWIFCLERGLDVMHCTVVELQDVRRITRKPRSIAWRYNTKRCPYLP